MIFDRQYRDIHRTRKIFKNLTLPTEGKIIDVSCGGGRLLKTIENSNSKLELFGIDITPGFLALNPKLSNINFLTAEATQLPFPDNTFDVTICSLSMHHYPNVANVLKEMCRVTKPNGSVYITDIMPTNNKTQYLYNKVRCREPYHFEKFYTEDEIESLAKNVSLKLVSKHHVSLFLRLKTLQFRK